MYNDELQNRRKIICFISTLIQLALFYDGKLFIKMKYIIIDPSKFCIFAFFFWQHLINKIRISRTLITICTLDYGTWICNKPWFSTILVFLRLHQITWIEIIASKKSVVQSGDPDNAYPFLHKYSSYFSASAQ